MSALLFLCNAATFAKKSATPRQAPVVVGKYIGTDFDQIVPA